MVHKIAVGGSVWRFIISGFGADRRPRGRPRLLQAIQPGSCSPRCVSDWAVPAARRACRARDGRAILRFITNAVSAPPSARPAGSGMRGRNVCGAAASSRARRIRVVPAVMPAIVPVVGVPVGVSVDTMAVGDPALIAAANIGISRPQVLAIGVRMHRGATAGIVDHLLRHRGSRQRGRKNYGGRAKKSEFRRAFLHCCNPRLICR
jgi:hypothetical protein